MNHEVSPLAFERLQEHHALELFEPFQAQQIYRFIPESVPESLESARREFHELSAVHPPDSTEIWHNWVILNRDTSVYMGTLQAMLCTDGSLWIGYKLAPIYWNKGFATKSVNWLAAELDRLYPKLPIHAAVDTKNYGSIRVLEKAGFALLRTEDTVLDGRASEDFIYKLLAT